MTKKHFNAIAKSLKAQYDMDYGEVDAQSFILHLSWMLAGAIQPFNGGFNPTKFVEACTKKGKN